MKTLTETMSNYRDMVISEKWDEKMHTPKDEKGKWDDWSLADLKGELSKLKNNPKKSDALKKREKQVYCYQNSEFRASTLHTTILHLGANTSKMK